MINTEKRANRACFTGHRPEKIRQTEQEICDVLQKAIKKAVADGIDVFITGMARGVDIWAAEIVLRLKNSGANIKLICASPYEGFERNWSARWQQRYNAVIQNADEVNFICEKFSRGCFQIRNKWMVDRSARVIAVFCGTSGGTKNTIDYAKRTGVECFNVLDNTANLDFRC